MDVVKGLWKSIKTAMGENGEGIMHNSYKMEKSDRRKMTAQMITPTGRVKITVVLEGMDGSSDSGSWEQLDAFQTSDSTASFQEDVPGQ